jgi:hypothetical protein
MTDCKRVEGYFMADTADVTAPADLIAEINRMTMVDIGTVLIQPTQELAKTTELQFGTPAEDVALGRMIKVTVEEVQRTV